MCGLVALVSRLPPQERRVIVSRMLSTLRHRGPDDSGIADREQTTLGFRRLSILDLSPLGHQPMDSADGACTIAFNGEIYNYVELRRELQALGHAFRSHSDTEVLLRAYMQWGPAAVERLRGMWAFVIVDSRRRVTFGSRDRFGIKPLYRWSDKTHLVLASELKAIRASGLYRDEIDTQIASDFLLDGRLDETPRSFFKGIEQIPAAHNFEVDGNGVFRQWRYWDLDAVAEKPQRDPAALYAELFEDAIRLHMRSDVPVAVHLSGGLDSTSIVCASARVRNAGAEGALKAFSFSDAQFDESRYIGDTVAQTGAELIQLNTSAGNVWNDLDAMLAFQDEPVHSPTAVISYQLMALTKAHGIRVILNGQGADETLGGYPSYFREGWVTLLKEGGLGPAWREVTEHALASGQERIRLFIDLLRHAIQGQARVFAPYRAMALSGYKEARRRLPWVTPQLVSRSTGYPNYRRPGLRSSLLDSVARAPLPLYLRVEDRNSMAHSVEARVPFLDHRLVEFAFSLPREWKLRGGLNKLLLREAMRGRIPDSVVSRRDKMGFPVPLARWMRHELHDNVKDLLTQRGDSVSDYVDTKALLHCLKSHRAGEADHSQVLFRAAQFILWRDAVRVSHQPSV